MICTTPVHEDLKHTSYFRVTVPVLNIREKLDMFKNKAFDFFKSFSDRSDYRCEITKTYYDKPYRMILHCAVQVCISSWRSGITVRWKASFLLTSHLIFASPFATCRKNLHKVWISCQILITCDKYGDACWILNPNWPLSAGRASLSTHVNTVELAHSVDSDILKSIL